MYVIQIALASRELASHLLADERAIGGVERRAVSHVELHLARMELAHDSLDVELALLGRVVHVEHQAGVVATEPDAVHAMRRQVERAVATRRVGVGLHHVELHLESEMRLVAERAPGLDGALQRAPRRQRQRLPVVLEIGNGNVGIDLPAGSKGLAERHGFEIGEAHVGAVALDREDVAVDAHRQGGHGVMAVLVQPGAGDVPTMRQAVDIGPHHPNATIPHGRRR